MLNTDQIFKTQSSTGKEIYSFIAHIKSFEKKTEFRKHNMPDIKGIIASPCHTLLILSICIHWTAIVDAIQIIQFLEHQAVTQCRRQVQCRQLLVYALPDAAPDGMTGQPLQ